MRLRGMTTIEFQSQSPLFPAIALGSTPFSYPTRSGRKRFALISTYDELCGIGAYTRSLEKQLSDFFDVTVFDLDQYPAQYARSRPPLRRQTYSRHLP